MDPRNDEVKKVPVEVEESKADPTIVEVKEMSKDEHLLATLGYRQVFIRSMGLFENWAATFVCNRPFLIAF